jgi:5-methylcytosine-specific restriction endonuclease McrA
VSVTLSSELRLLVSGRAHQYCEYCLLPQSIALHKHEPDHIVPIQHGGETEAENLALACMRCNRYKGPNVGSFDPETGDLVPFFNPRQQQWKEHFALEAGVIVPLTAVARVTVKIFRFNDQERIDERQKLIEVGLYPIH